MFGELCRCFLPGSGSPFKGLCRFFVIENRAIRRRFVTEYLTMNELGEVHFLHCTVIRELGADFVPKPLLVLLRESLHCGLLL